MEEKKQINIEFKNFAGCRIFITDKISNTEVIQGEKNLNLFTTIEFFDFMKSHLKSISQRLAIVNQYINYEDDIENDLDNQEKYFSEDDKHYRLGGNFAVFCETSKNIGDHIILADNNTAADIIRKKYNLAYPDNELNIESEMSDCIVYTSSREEAIRFKKWFYQYYVKPWIDKNDEGWEEFAKLYESSTPERKQRLSLLVHKYE